MKTFLVLAIIIAVVYWFYKKSKIKVSEIGIVKGITWLRKNKIAAITIENEEKTSTYEVYIHSTETVMQLAHFEKKPVQVKIEKKGGWDFPFFSPSLFVL